MYKHLLVPVDSSSLSAANVSVASNLAKALGARISFFYAAPDFGSTGEGALMHAIDPDKYVAGFEGEQTAIISKAVVATRLMGVVCEGYSVVSDRPAEAIVKAATDLECDLIVMASRGAKGVNAWLSGSKTQKVLKNANVSLLVTRVEANEPLTAGERAVAVIKDEHRALAVVMDSMRQIAKGVAEGSVGVDSLRALQAMLDYVKAFPQSLHHPKEEQYLHPLLRQRCPESAKVLEELEAQHRREGELVRAMEVALKAWKVGDMASSQALVEGLQTLADAVLKHMGKEEMEILPLAEQHLTAADWQAIAEAFDENKNPEFANMEANELRQLFVRITQMTQEVSST